jgi:hypothetical protein
MCVASGPMIKRSSRDAFTLIGPIFIEALAPNQM